MDFLRNPEIRKLVKVYVFLTVFEVLGAAVLSLVLCGSSSSSGSSSGRGAGVSLSVAMAAAALYVFLTCAVNAGLFFYFTRKRYDGISELSSRLDQILHGAVSMDFVPDREGELAVLTSEIYKMTVRLRDQAETLKREKVYLRDSLADISHQLRTPLTSIHLLASRLQREDLESRERADTARNISRLLSRMEWLISSLLKIAKLESDTIAFRQTRVSVGDLIREAMGPVDILVELKNIVCEFEIEEGCGFLGDGRWSAEAIGNILKNCAEHTPPGGRIRVQAAENPLHTEIIISDTGTGIAPEELPRLFDRFYRGKDSGWESAGIGLALARMIIRKQNGTIKAGSGREQGTEFHIRFYKGAV